MEAPLIGKVDTWVSQRRFQLKHWEYGFGGNVFDGEVRYPVSFDGTGADLKMDSWGCGVYALYNGLRVLRVDARLQEVVDLSLANGVKVGDGVGMWHIQKGFEHFGMAAVALSLQNSPVDLLPYLAGGSIFCANIWEMSHDEVADSRQRGDGHWAVGVGTNGRGDLLLVDSSLRSGAAGVTYGLMTLTREGFGRVACDCTGEVDHTETRVKPGGDWGWQFGFLVGPKGMRQEELLGCIRQNGGVNIYDWGK